MQCWRCNGANIQGTCLLINQFPPRSYYFDCELFYVYIFYAINLAWSLRQIFLQKALVQIINILHCGFLPIYGS